MSTQETFAPLLSAATDMAIVKRAISNSAVVGNYSKTTESSIANITLIFEHELYLDSNCEFCNI